MHANAASTELRRVEILLVEDNPGDVALIRAAFESIGLNHALHHVADGVLALEYFANPKSAKPDLILLDLNLPRLSGWEVLATLKHSIALRKIPVVIFSGSCDAEDVNRGYDLLANAYVPKPTGFDNLVDSIRTMDRFWCQLAELPKIETTKRQM